MRDFEGEMRLYSAGSGFEETLRKKLGLELTPEIVARCLKKEYQDRIRENNLVVFKGLFGWGWARRGNGITSCGTGTTFSQQMLDENFERNLKNEMAPYRILV